jgi:hypothetical protein
MDAEAKKEIEGLKAQLAAQSAQFERQTKLLEGVLTMAQMNDEAKIAAAQEIARKKKLVADIRAKASELQAVDGKKPDVVKYVIGEVMHYRRGVQYNKNGPNKIIALPNDELPENQPSWTWKPYDPKQRAEDPQVAEERKALSQLAKEQAQKPVGPLAPAKKAARPSDTEV